MFSKSDIRIKKTGKNLLIQSNNNSMRKLFLILIAMIRISVNALAQDSTIHGRVISADDNEPVV